MMADRKHCGKNMDFVNDTSAWPRARHGVNRRCDVFAMLVGAWVVPA